MPVPRILTVVLAAMLLLGGTSATSDAKGADQPGVFPPGSTPYGQSYGEWSADWWQQVLRIPTSSNPLFEEGKVTCGLGTDDVVFLVGTFGGKARRSCSVEPGTALLLPLVNAACTKGGGDGDTRAELRACAATLADSVDSVNATVDGRSLKGLLKRFRFASRGFFVRLPEDNVLGAPAGRTLAAANGYWVMLRPLDSGRHTVSFGGTAGDFSTQVSYRITVKQAS